MKYAREGLGEVLVGDRLATTPFRIQFKEDQTHQNLCDMALDEAGLKKFFKAVKEDYYFQMYFDELPLWGFIGKVEKIIRPGEETQLKYYLFTHIHFDITYNEDKVIEINVSTDPARTIDITGHSALDVSFSYSVKWKETSIPYERRMEKYSRYSFLPQHLEIHWFSIINSCVTVLLLTGFLATILMRVLKNDILTYSREEDLEADNDETGWKYIHGDVFRFPKNKTLLCAVVGTGTQFLVLTLFIFFLALVGAYLPYNRGSLLASVVVFYALTAGIAGYTSGLLYKQLGGENWVRNNILTAFLFCGPVLCIFAWNNTVAIIYRSTAALPFGTICIIIVMWALITLPLTVLGGIYAKNSKKEFQAPSRTSKYARAIPPMPWYRTSVPQMCMAGFLPFSAIYIELYYIFASVWGHKVYTIYSILFIVFIILLVVTAFITVSLAYFQLAVEDYRWWWRSVLCGGSTGFFVFAYCFYYYFARSDMSGLMQTSFFFGYMLVACWGFFLMLGAVGWRASLMFIRHIYKAIRAD